MNLTKLCGLTPIASKGGSSLTTSPFVTLLSTILDSCENQIFHDFYVVFTRTSTVPAKVCILQNMPF